MNDLYTRLLEDALAGGASGTVIAIVGTYFLRKFIATEVGKAVSKGADVVRRGLEITKDGEITEAELRG
ncbi:hypothetical protein D0962_05660 [Leptolyngbyaceae cyanobacterium CCMR0082]|uniref:Uncharacterized protein n=1 Tax=Adonisia turfae CCMR0082 TaxID=2304604 RepID=A0A6M0S1L6_9CYAN|nr:hypothetical protein [Adonisia turfae]NEZ62266.1 hypothetical protein [Adonisia turfae CCMR0082]